MEDIEADSYHIIYRLVKQMKQENKDTVGKKFIWDDDSVLAFHEEDRKNAWKQHYESWLNPSRRESVNCWSRTSTPSSHY